MLSFLLWLHIGCTPILALPDECGLWQTDIDTIAVEAEAQFLQVHFAAERMTIPKAFIFARSLWSPGGNGVLVVDCVSKAIGVRLRDFEVGMDCAVPRLQRAWDGIDPMPGQSEIAVKTLHVLRELRDWDQHRTCASWSILIATLVFWGCLGLIAVFCHPFGRQRLRECWRK